MKVHHLAVRFMGKKVCQITFENVGRSGHTAGWRLGSFRIFGCEQGLFGIAFGDGVSADPCALGGCASLRSPPLGMTTGAGIGFVSHFWFGCVVNWVRFAETGGSGTLGMLELGSFRIIAGCRLGSFCIFCLGPGGCGGKLGFPTSRD